MLKIYNTLTQKKETFKPMRVKEVGMYVCGMTVYDFCHIGHARVVVVFDVILRYLKMQGYQVNYIRKTSVCNTLLTLSMIKLSNGLRRIMKALPN